ncbi:MAG: tRNA (N6-threonylcarbamoyladenosine(37)-N6)-methyltransferase TrmO [Bacillota bacterium]
MNASLQPIRLQPIGQVVNGCERPPADGWDNVVSEIVLRPGLEKHFIGLDKFSHAYVLYWMHVDTARLQEQALVHPQGRKDLPLVGVFATHSPCRPNPIGVTVVKLLQVSPLCLQVQGLDALDGSPVLDIKSFAGTAGLPIANSCPTWVQALRLPKESLPANEGHR